MFLKSSIDNTGRLSTTELGVINSTMAGFGYVDGILKTSSAADEGTDVILNGIRVASDGSVRVTDSVGVNQSQGFQVDATGRLCISVGAAGTNFRNGVATDNDGRVFATEAADPPGAVLWDGTDAVLWDGTDKVLWD